jgi:thiamine-monophosphate kinase
MTTVVENALIESLVAGLPRSDLQVGALQESDAELIRLPGTGDLLAVTTDSIAEEIELGLYRDPYLIGWMAVIVNASDLAAVGADPVGVLLSETLPSHLTVEDRSRLQDGIRDACAASRLPVLGGDTNVASHFQIGATAIGLVRDGVPMTRVGCQPGDLLYATGLLGHGSCFALAQLNGSLAPAVSHLRYQPTPRLQEGRTLRSFATACMDTSDGALAAIDQLMRVNDVGFDIDLSEAVHPAARDLATVLGLPSWMMLAGLHGEFELLFTVPPGAVEELLDAAECRGWTPVRLGRVVSDAGVWIVEHDGRISLDTGRIRNLFAEPPGSLESLVARLKTMVEPCTQ